jgi:hypothetical protein
VILEVPVHIAHNYCIFRHPHAITVVAAFAFEEALAESRVVAAAAVCERIVF